VIAVSPTVLHIPHASIRIPDEVRGQFVLTTAALCAELLAMTDHHTDDLFTGLVEGAAEIRHPVSRLVVDPERFADDDDEAMSRVGMGVVYTKTSRGAPLRRALTAGERDRLVEEWYRPHHARFTEAVSAALAVDGSCLIVDCHSFPSVPLPYESDQNPDRPDICLGSDPLHTPLALLAATVAAFEDSGLRVAVNRPFGGSIVPMEFYGSDLRVRSVMVEVNRKLYMDEWTGEKGEGFGRMRRTLGKVLGAVARLDGAGA
jgi:N-formylglutamate deformylase